MMRKPSFNGSQENTSPDRLPVMKPRPPAAKDDTILNNGFIMDPGPRWQQRQAKLHQERESLTTAPDSQQAQQLAGSIKRRAKNAWEENTAAIEAPPTWVQQLLERVGELEQMVEDTSNENSQLKARAGRGVLEDAQISPGPGKLPLLDQLQERVTACEKAELRNELGLEEVNKYLTSPERKQEMTNLVKHHLRAALAALLQEGGEMNDLIKTAVAKETASLATRLRNMEERELQMMDRVAALEAAGPRGGPDTPAAVQKTVSEQKAVAAQLETLQEQLQGEIKQLREQREGGGYAARPADMKHKLSEGGAQDTSAQEQQTSPAEAAANVAAAALAVDAIPNAVRTAVNVAAGDARVAAASSEAIVGSVPEAIRAAKMSIESAKQDAAGISAAAAAAADAVPAAIRNAIMGARRLTALNHTPGSTSMGNAAGSSLAMGAMNSVAMGNSAAGAHAIGTDAAGMAALYGKQAAGAHALSNATMGTSTGFSAMANNATGMTGCGPNVVGVGAMDAINSGMGTNTVGAYANMGTGMNSKASEDTAAMAAAAINSAIPAVVRACFLAAAAKNKAGSAAAAAAAGAMIQDAVPAAVRASMLSAAAAAASGSGADPVAAAAAASAAAAAMEDITAAMQPSMERLARFNQSGADLADRPWTSVHNGSLAQMCSLAQQAGKVESIEAALRQQEKLLAAQGAQINALMATAAGGDAKAAPAAVVQALQTELEQVKQHNEKLTQQVQAVEKQTLEALQQLKQGAGGQAEERLHASRAGAADAETQAAVAQMASRQQQIEQKTAELEGFMKEALVTLATQAQANQAQMEASRQGDIKQLLEHAAKETDSKLAAFAPLDKLRELESLLSARLETALDARLSFKANEIATLESTVNEVIAEVSKAHAELTAVRATNVMPSNAMLPMGVMENIEAQLLAHLEGVLKDMLGGLDSKYAGLTALRQAQEQTRANEQAILVSLNELDTSLHERITGQDQALLKMARQVDVVQSYLRMQDASFGAPQPAIVVSQMPTGLRTSMLGQRTMRRQVSESGSRSLVNSSAESFLGSRRQASDSGPAPMGSIAEGPQPSLLTAGLMADAGPDNRTAILAGQAGRTSSQSLLPDIGWGRLPSDSGK